MLQHACIGSRKNLVSATTASPFTANDRGNIAILTALCLTLIFGAAGGAIDFGRAYSARNHTQTIMDAAVLAGGRVLQTTQDESAAIAAANAYYNSMKSDVVTGPSAAFTIESNKTVVRGAIAGKVDTHLLRVFNINELGINIDVNSQLAGGSTSGTNYELSIMLDVTGSMCDNGVGPCTNGTKMNALKAAATDLINIVVWDNQGKYRSRAAIVPFSTRIRVGPDGGGGPMMKRLTNLKDIWSGWYNICTSSSGGGGSEGGGNWSCSNYASTQVNNWRVMPCVTDRTGPQEFTDANPGSNTWLNAHDGGRMMLSWDSSDTAATTQLGKTSADPANNWNYDDVGGCADVDEANEVLPLTADKNILRAKINGLSAFGATSGALGTAWAWYMLSPNWDDIWTGNSRPDSYSELTELEDGRPKLKKVAVLMTDGEYNTYRGWKDSDQNAVSNNAKTICQNMKNAGIEIYTVGFGLDQLAPDKRAVAEATLKACGTDIQHFYNALNVAELQGAFRDIAVKLAVLRLKK
jgi:Flp pilus assembly protein TadG